MDNILIILTDRYPFSNGETYVETERPYWSKYDHVYICPVLVRKEDRIRSNFTAMPHETVVSTEDFKPGFFDALKGLIGYVSFWDYFYELKALKNTRRLSARNIRSMFVMGIFSNLRAKRIEAVIKSYLGKSETETVLLYSYWMYEPALVSIGLKKSFPSAKLISRAHGYDLYEERQKNRYVPFRHLVLGSMDRIYPISENGRMYLHNQYHGKYDEKIEVRRLGTKRAFDLSNDRRDTGKFTIVSCSNLVPLKRVDRIVEALKMYDGDVEWVHFGDGELMDSLRSQAGKLPSRIHAHFMGRVPNEDVQRFYSTYWIDVFVNVSETEGVPVSIMEAQSYGIPVIATDVGGTSEIVINGENGVLLNKSFSNEELLGAFEDVIKNREKYRTEAFRTWERLSDANKLYEEFFTRELNALMAD